MPESLLNDELSDNGDEDAGAKGNAGPIKQGGGGRPVAGTGSGSSAASRPRVVDRLRRTRASSASDNAASKLSKSTIRHEGNEDVMVVN